MNDAKTKLLLSVSQKAPIIFFSVNDMVNHWLWHMNYKNKTKTVPVLLVHLPPGTITLAYVSIFYWGKKGIEGEL